MSSTTPACLLTALVVAACSAPVGVEAELVEAADVSSGIDVGLARLATVLGPDPAGVLVQPALPCVALAAAAGNTPAGGRNDYHFTQCSVPGLGLVQGDVDLVYAVNGPALHVDLQATGLTIDTVTVDSWTASADVTESGNDRTAVWQSLASGSTTVQQSTRTFTDDASATLKWTTGSSCLAVDGQVSSTFQTSDGSELSYVAALSSFVACAPAAGTACPESGSEVRADLSGGGFIRLSYGANDAASYTNDKGQTFPFAPSCAP